MMIHRDCTRISLYSHFFTHLTSYVHIPDTVLMTLCPPDIEPTCHWTHLSLNPLDIVSNCHRIYLSLFSLDIESTWQCAHLSSNLPVIVPIWHWTQLTLCPHVILSTYSCIHLSLYDIIPTCQHTHLAKFSNLSPHFPDKHCTLYPLVIVYKCIIQYPPINKPIWHCNHLTVCQPVIVLSWHCEYTHLTFLCPNS